MRPPVAVDDEKTLTVGPTLPVMVVLFRKRNFMFPVPVPASKSAAAAPLLVNVQPETVMPFAERVASPMKAVSCANDWIADEKLALKVTPETVAVVMTPVPLAM